MPVARIISPNFEDALKFADYLRPFFDTVEIAQPGRAYETIVDLEVNLQLCTPEQAWEQVAQLGTQPDTDIFVAPGTLVPTSEQESLNDEEDWQAEDVEDAFEAQPSAAEPALAGAQNFNSAGDQGATEPADANGSGARGAFSLTPAWNWLRRTRESLQQRLAIRALLRELQQVEHERRQKEQQRQRQMALQFERERREQEARERALARAAEQQQSAIQEAERQRWEQEEAQRLEQEAILRRQAEEEQLRREAEQEEVLRRGAFVEEILRRRVEEQSMEAAPPLPVTEPVAPEFEAVPAEAVAVASAAAVSRASSARVNSRRLPMAMALAGVTSMLLMAVLVGYAYRRPASPVPLSVLQRSNEVEQKVPFGPAVLPASSKLPAPVLETSENVQPAAVSSSEDHGFQSDFRRVRVDGREVDYIADDVTVRHFTTPPRGRILKHPASDVHISASSSGVKQISDME
jgi:chemotaxis protein histidine kinase CheA